jgi:hypothetical protein
MFLKDKQSGSLLKVVELDNLFSPTHDSVKGKLQDGQNEQPAESFSKENLVFPSGEDLPLCWLDADYRLNSEPE